MNREPWDEALVYLAEHNVVSLATTGPEGVWSAALFYVNEGFTLYFLSAPTSRHSCNIAAQPDVAGTIQEDYEDWARIRGIQFEGSARRLDANEQRRAVALYRRKFPFVDTTTGTSTEIASALDAIAWYEVVPSEMYFIDNSLGLGHRDRIALG